MGAVKVEPDRVSIDNEGRFQTIHSRKWIHRQQRQKFVVKNSSFFQWNSSIYSNIYFKRVSHIFLGNERACKNATQRVRGSTSTASVPKIQKSRKPEVRKSRKPVTCPVQPAKNKDPLNLDTRASNPMNQWASELLSQWAGRII